MIGLQTFAREIANEPTQTTQNPTPNTESNICKIKINKKPKPKYKKLKSIKTKKPKNKNQKKHFFTSHHTINDVGFNDRGA
jgi:hypothetical protein